MGVQAFWRNPLRVMGVERPRGAVGFASIPMACRISREIHYGVWVENGSRPVA